MPISARARARMKLMTAAEKKQVRAAAKTLYNSELLGVKRMRAIVRAAEK